MVRSDVPRQSRFDSIRQPGATILLVGCGAIGSVIAKHLCASDMIDTVVLADVDGDLAKRVATATRSRKARAMRLDASDEEALAEGMRGCTVVINAALPRFNPTIRKVALTSGVHYIDLAAESTDPYAESDAWRAAGLTGLVGMGEDPGLSNLMARLAADGMEQVESIKVRDGDTASSPEYPFVALFSPETFVEETLNASRIWRDGKYEVVEPFGEREVFEFPEPVGPQTVYSVDHEEVDSLPRFIGKGVRYVDFKLAIDDATVRSLKLFRDLRLLERGPPNGPSPRQALFSVIPKPGELAGHVDGYAALVVEVSGYADGERRVHTLYTVLGHREAAQAYGTTGTAYLTGTPAAVGAILLASGRVKERGLLAPESLDPRPFFPMLRERGIIVKERITTEREVV